MPLTKRRPWSAIVAVLDLKAARKKPSFRPNEKDHTKIHNFIQEFGVPNVKEWLHAINSWIDFSNPQDSARSLQNQIKITKRFLKKKPVLFRGETLKEGEEEKETGQNIVFRRPVPTSWTFDLKEAKYFSKLDTKPGGMGVVYRLDENYDPIFLPGEYFPSFIHHLVYSINVGNFKDWMKERELVIPAGSWATTVVSTTKPRSKAAFEARKTWGKIREKNSWRSPPL